MIICIYMNRLKVMIRLNEPIVYFTIIIIICAFFAYKIVVKAYDSFDVLDVGYEKYYELKIQKTN